MAKKIKITEEEITKIRAEFDEALSKRMTDGKFSFVRDFSKVDRKATVYFTPLAYCKMQRLIQDCDKEIAWKGTVEKLENDGYLIDDIYCFPQITTAATVTTDDEEEAKWVCSLPYEVLEKLRMQGHSHVNMGVTPSGTDNDYYKDVTSTLHDDEWYIFMIWNKKGDRTIKIFDYEKNIFFDTADCRVAMWLEGFDLDAWSKDSLAMLKSPTPPTTYTYQNNFWDKFKTGSTKTETPKKIEGVASTTKKDGKKSGKIKKTDSVKKYYSAWEDDDDLYDYSY